MADEPVSIGRTWVTISTITCLLFNAGVVCWLLAFGRSDNALHVTAMSWSYMTAAGMFAGLGFGALAPMVSMLMGRK